MDSGSCHEMLKNAGFAPIGSLSTDVRMTLWWNGVHHVEVAVVDLESAALLRATKCYRLTAMGEEGEMYSRDLAAFEASLTSGLFNEVHMHLSYYPDITPSMARRRIGEKRFRQADGQTPDSQAMTERLEQSRARFQSLQEELRRNESLLRLDHGRSTLTQRYLQEQISRLRTALQQLQNSTRTDSQNLAAQRQLEAEYQQKGSATCLLLSICSNVQLALSDQEFADAVEGAVKEVRDLDRYQLRQKLQGGKLQIFLEAVDSPGISLLTRWAGGSMCPRQLARLGPEAEPLRRKVEEQFMVLPRTDILLGGAIQDERKLVGARIVRNFMERLEKVPSASTTRIALPKGLMPVWIGSAVMTGDHKGQPWELPLGGMLHCLISGRTGSGKSCLARVLVEGLVVYEDLAILILDPRCQWAGLLWPEDRSDVLARYGSFGFEPGQARSFPFTCHGVGSNLGEPLPEDLKQLALGRRIVSFKGMDDRARCELFARILEEAFEANATAESDRPRLLVVVEEITRFLKKGVPDEAQDAAHHAELSVDRVAREGRKYGVNLLLLGQSSKDLSYTMASTRQNITTRIFMGNSDREIEYADEFLEDGRMIVSLPPGEAIVCNPQWGQVRIAVRPPLSKVWEPGDEELRRLVGTRQGRPHAALSADAHAVLELVGDIHRQTAQPVRLLQVVRQLGITSRRRIDRIVAELQQAAAARFQHLPERGQPLIVIPILPDPCMQKPGGNVDRTGRKEGVS